MIIYEPFFNYFIYKQLLVHFCLKVFSKNFIIMEIFSEFFEVFFIKKNIFRNFLKNF